VLFVLRFRGGLSWAAAAVVTFPTLPRRQRAETSTQYLRAAAVNAWARRRANVKLSDAGLALGRFGQRAKPVKPGVILALSLSIGCLEVARVKTRAQVAAVVILAGASLRGAGLSARSPGALAQRRTVPKDSKLHC